MSRDSEVCTSLWNSQWNGVWVQPLSLLEVRILLLNCTNLLRGQLRHQGRLSGSDVTSFLCVRPHWLHWLRKRASALLAAHLGDGQLGCYILTEFLATWPLAPLDHRNYATTSASCDQFLPGRLIHRSRVKLMYTPHLSQHLFSGSAVLVFCFSQGSTCMSKHDTPT